jgi:Nitroreductase family
MMNALKLRHSTREYSDRPLPVQTLSDLLWAAFGINRPSGDRTAPYWRHFMVIDIYVAMADGVWTYEPKAHGLLPYLLRDIRAATGVQDFFGTAPLNLVYVAHGERMTDISPEERRLLRLGRYRLHRPERLFVLRLGRPCNRLPGSGRLSEAYPHIEAAGPAVRELCADCRVSARLNARNTSTLVL